MTPSLFLLMFGNFFLISIFAIGGFMASLPGMRSCLLQNNLPQQLLSASPCRAQTC